MARVRWNGQEFNATLIDQLPNGNYRMKATEHGPRGTLPRVEAGTVIEVRQDEIVGLNIGNAKFLGPGAQAQIAGQQSGQISTSVPLPDAVGAPVILTRDAPVVALARLLAAGSAVSVSPAAAPAPQPAPSRTTAMANTPKLNSLMGSYDAFTARVEAAADAVHKRLDAIGGQAETSTAKLSKAVDPIEAMVKQIDDTANQLTNGGPPLGN